MDDKKQLTTIIAGAERDPYHILYMGLMRPQDDTLISRGGGRGLKIYDEIERDCHAYSVLQKRKYAVVSFPWEVKPASERLKDKKAAETVKAMLEALDFDGLCVGLLDALLKGYAVGEVIWDPATWAPTQVIMRDQRRFLFDVDSKPRLATLQNMLPGEELPERKFIVHRFGAKDANPYGLGLGSRLFWPTYFKRQGITFWLVFAEKFGSPTVLGKYPEGMPQDKQDALLSTLGNLAQETAIVAPLETEIELLEAARSGSIDTYERLVRYMDEEISKAVLGEMEQEAVIDDNYFWSDQHGTRLQYAGRPVTAPSLHFTVGSATEDKFLVLAAENGAVASVFSLGLPRDFVRASIALRQGQKVPLPA